MSSTLRPALFLAVVLAWVAPARAADALTVEGTVNAPPGAVWSAFATSAGLASWMAPHADIDLRLGGAMRVNYRPQGRLGDSATIVNRILAFEPRRMLALRVAQAPAGFPFPQAIRQMWTVIYFEPAGGDRTRLRVVSLGFGDDQESRAMKTFFDEGNTLTLRKLQRKFGQ